MQIASFNVNSIRVRLPHVLSYLDDAAPDVLGLQETKTPDEFFPAEEIEKRGYQVIRFGQKSYNGVALLTKLKPVLAQNGFESDGPDDQKRFQYAMFELPGGRNLKVVNGYFPQGENRSHPVKFPLKMKFYDDLLSWLGQQSPEDLLLVMGDLNVSPEDKDIGIGEKNAKRWLKEGKCSFLPEERKRIDELKAWGLYDSFRLKHPDVSNRFSWFDYRSRGFDDDPKRGLRIDQIWITSPLSQLLVDAGIDYRLRAMEKPSDHCLIWANFNL